MVAIHHKHETPAGFLNVVVEHLESTDQHLSVCMEFECAETGAMFDATYSHSDLCDICPIFGESEELMDALCEPPIINIDDSKEIAVVRFTARGRKREYPADLTLMRRVYDDNKKDVIELRAENSVLRRRLAKVEDDVDKLAAMTLVSIGVYNKPKFDELLRMMKCPLRTLENIADQDELINSLREDGERTAWFTSLNPDLRKFHPMSSTEYTFANVFSDPDHIIVLEITRILVSAHIDVNHIHSTKWRKQITCHACGFKNRSDDLEFHIHQCTPLDAIQKCIDDDDGLFGGSINDAAAHATRRCTLLEIRRILINAGAKAVCELSQKAQA